MKFKWIPRESYGIFRFGFPLSEEALDILEFEPETDSTNWLKFRLSGEDILVFTENSLVISVACYSRFEIEGVNLIGSTLVDATKLIGETPEAEVDEIEIEGTVQFVYEFDDSGLQLWVEKGKVATVFIS